MHAKRRRHKSTPGTYRHRFALTATLLLVFLIISPWLIWLARPSTEVRMLVLDKTVPSEPAKQHAALAWVSHHLKLLDSEGGRHQATLSYRGYHPQAEEGARVTPLAPIPRDTDIVYIADTYGVYKREQDIATFLAEGERNLIYGGMDQSDVDALRSFLNRDVPNTLVAEYNTFATPTPDYIQRQLYDLLHAQWTGWAGLQVAELSRDGDAPAWVYAMYEKQHGKPWTYSGRGYILYNTDEEILVLAVGDDVGEDGIGISFTEAGTRDLGLQGTWFYNHMFDITEPLADGEVLATYDIDVTPAGAEKLARYGLPTRFPAIIKGGVGMHRTYYLAGNWSYSPDPLKFSFLAGVPPLMRTSSSDSIVSEHSFLWHVYEPLIRAIGKETLARKQMPSAQHTPESTIIEGTKMIARTQAHMLQVWRHGTWEDLFVHGVNLGIAMPGKWFTDFPKDKSLYYRWLVKIGGMGADTVRIYTLLDPEFYQALHLYNTLNPERMLYLMQEIWPEEEPHGNDYLAADYQRAYEEEIRHVIDAIHGNADIPERRGRAWGTYRSNVAPYVIGYLVGRELEPHEVEATDLLNEGYSFTGEYIRATQEATPTEAWLAASMDYVASYEQSAYGWQHPVAIVNWPTLDPIDHPSERNEQGEKIKESNDRITVDINNLLPGPALKAGLFGAYHIYPNYPDFMNNDPLYDLYEDEQGRLRYGGYLRQFMEYHSAYPAVVAEFGLATGMGNAHASPDGYHHGSMTETQQGEGIVRMFEAMKREGYAGGIIFEWMDEWAKKTWTTEPYMIPYDRHILWHNTVDPEQNYGILAYEAVKPNRATIDAEGSGSVNSVLIRADASFLHLDIELKTRIDLHKEQVLIGLDTFARERGELLYDPRLPHEAPTGMEYLVVIDGVDSARLLAIPPANGSTYAFSSHEGLVRTGTFVDMRKLTNKARAFEDGTPIPAIFEESGALSFGDLKGSTNHWNMDGTTLSIRIPWTRINVADPSSATVLDDRRRFNTDPARDVLTTSVSEGIAVSVLQLQKKTDLLLGSFGLQEGVVMPWKGWNQPYYRERLKESYDILHEYLAQQREL